MVSIRHRKILLRKKSVSSTPSTYIMSMFFLAILLILITIASALPNNDHNNNLKNIDKDDPLALVKIQTANTKKIEDEFHQNQINMREYWEQTFEEIRASNPVIFPPEEEKSLMLERLERWKLFSAPESSSVFDTAGRSSMKADDDVEGEEDVPSVANGDYFAVADIAAANTEDDEKRYKLQQLFKSTNSNIRPPIRFDGLVTWEKLKQQWKDDVTVYLNTKIEKYDKEKNQPTWVKYLMKGKEENSRYDLSNFGVPSQSLQQIRTAANKAKKEVEVYADEVKAEASADEVSSDKQQLQSESISKDANLSSSLSSQRTPPIVSPPITLTNLDPNLPPIPKPRPVTSSDKILPHTDIADKSKNIWIVTTGALPWMTGTAVNPLLRAAYLSTGRKEAGGSVTLMLPWVERNDDQKRVYGKENMFTSPSDQETYIRTWLRDTANMPQASNELNIQWYTAWQEVLENSLYSMGDIIGLIPERDCDICVLEEPEHLNWYRAPGENWTSKFKHVVGIVHTNYFVYALEQPAAFIRAPGMRLLSSWMCRSHCHRIIKLSGTLQQFAPEKELIENVHGVRRSFLDTGEKLRTKLLTYPDIDEDPIFSANATPTVYFIGKMLWSKGLESLMDLIQYAEDSAGLRVEVDMYGGGPNKDEASERADKMGLDMKFHGPIDHAELGWTHKVFINPSTSEVLCTTVAEALAMGKFVVLPSHPSNDFFAQFPNCLPYTNKEEFVGNLYYALTHSPEPLTKEYSYALSWEAATERFAAAGSISVAEAEAIEDALSSTDAGIDVSLPPLTADEEQRKKITKTFKRTRRGYRSFRSKLSQEISKSNVLPKPLQQRLTAELDKRLDVDLDKLLSSPKLRVKLSPAKLDKLLLELYDSVVQGPSGDVFRVIGGGSNVGRQNLYMKQQQGKQPLQSVSQSTFIEENEPEYSLPETTTRVAPTSLVQRALKRNFPQATTTLLSSMSEQPSSSSRERKTKETPKMSIHLTRQISDRDRSKSSWGIRLVHQGSFTRVVPPKHRYSPLI